MNTAVAAMTRLAFDVGDWGVRDYRGEAPLTEAAIDEHQATFLNARLWDYRPLWTSSRRFASTTTSTMSTPTGTRSATRPGR
jgi:uncharacterized membrane protein (UPF0182 family)